MKILIEKKLLLLIIVALATFLRLYQLNSVPPSPSLDEVSIGYNAYSILHTGADEYGTKFPIVLRAYDDYRPATYAYLTAPFIYFFGLSVTAVRLPSVILSIITVILTYGLVKELFYKTYSPGLSEHIAHGASALLAISAWHIYISRLGHEANLGLTLVVLGVYLFLRAVHRNHGIHLILSGAVFALSLNSYQSEKIITPLLALGLFVVYLKDVRAMRVYAVKGAIVGVLLSIPILLSALQPGGLMRLSATSIFSDAQVLTDWEYHYQKALRDNDRFGQIVHRRKIYMFRVVARQYIEHFNPIWLFTGSAAERHKVPGLGLLYPWEAGLILLGLFVAFKSLKKAKALQLVLWWLLISPLPAALTTQAPHAMRSYTFIPSWQIVGALGMLHVGLYMKRQKLTAYLWIASSIVLVGSLVYFTKQYLFVFPNTQSDSFQYALGRAINVVRARAPSYDHVVFSNTQALYQSYMFFLFYTGYDPKVYLRSGGTGSGGFRETHTIGKYEFRPIDWNKELYNGLYVGNVSDFPEGIESTVVTALDGTAAIKIVERNI